MRLKRFRARHIVLATTTVAATATAAVKTMRLKRFRARPATGEGHFALPWKKTGMPPSIMMWWFDDVGSVTLGLDHVEMVDCF